MTEERADSVINGGPPALSLPAEVLLLSIDPAEGGLLPHRRRRLRKALGLASRGSADAGPGSGGTAIEELEAAGIAARRGLRRRLEVIDRRAAGASWRRLTAAISAGEEPGVRDGELILLLAWTGVLSHRLSRYERRLAARHLRRLGADSIEEPRIRGAGDGRALATDGVGHLGWLGVGGMATMAAVATSELGASAVSGIYAGGGSADGGADGGGDSAGGGGDGGGGGGGGG